MPGSSGARSRIRRRAIPRCTTLDPRRRIQRHTRRVGFHADDDAFGGHRRDARLLEANVTQGNDCRRNSSREVSREIAGLHRQPVPSGPELPVAGATSDPLQRAARPLRAAHHPRASVDEEEPVHPFVRPVAHANDVAVTVAVRRERPRAHAHDPDGRPRCVHGDGVRQDDRPVGPAQLDLRAVAPFGHERPSSSRPFQKNSCGPRAARSPSTRVRISRPSSSSSDSCSRSARRSRKEMSARRCGHRQTGENTLSTTVPVTGDFSTFSRSATPNATAEPTSSARATKSGALRRTGPPILEGTAALSTELRGREATIAEPSRAPFRLDGARRGRSRALPGESPSGRRDGEHARRGPTGETWFPPFKRYGGPAMRCVAPVLAGLGLVAVITAPSAGAKRIGPIDLVSHAGIRIVGEAASDRVGWAVARAGDVNGDRRMDVIIGAPSAGNNGRDSSGSAYVVFGQRSTATIDLASLGGGGFRIDGAAQGDVAGFAVSTAGDVNGDGLADVVVGAPEADNNFREQSGSAYVVFGQRTAAPVDLSALGGRGFRIDGASAAPSSRASRSRTPATSTATRGAMCSWERRSPPTTSSTSRRRDSSGARPARSTSSSAGHRPRTSISPPSVTAAFASTARSR